MRTEVYVTQLIPTLVYSPVRKADKPTAIYEPTA
jgi:hypothetical protein